MRKVSACKDNRTVGKQLFHLSGWLPICELWMMHEKCCLEITLQKKQIQMSTTDGSERRLAEILPSPRPEHNLDDDIFPQPLDFNTRLIRFVTTTSAYIRRVRTSVSDVCSASIQTHCPSIRLSLFYSGTDTDECRRLDQRPTEFTVLPLLTM